MTKGELRVVISEAIRKKKISIAKGASLLIYLMNTNKSKRQFKPRPAQKTNQLDRAVQELEAQESALQGRTN